MANHIPHLLLQTSPTGDLEFGIGWSVTRWQPRTDVYETNKGLLIQVEAAGIDERDLRIQFEPGQLVIEGRRACPCFDEGAHCLQVEIDHGPFRRVLAIPAYADGNNITARYENGLLLITVPRRAPATPQNVRVAID